MPALHGKGPGLNEQLLHRKNLVTVVFAKLHSIKPEDLILYSWPFAKLLLAMFSRMLRIRNKIRPIGLRLQPPRAALPLRWCLYR